MTKTQKRILVTMAIVMLLVFGSVVTLVYSQHYNRVMTDFQSQMDAQAAAEQMKIDNIALLHK